MFRCKSAAQFFSNVHFFLYYVIEVLFSFSETFMSVLCSVMLSFLYFSILLMVLECMIICECICLLLSSSVVCLFFETLHLLLFATISFCLVGCSVSVILKLYFSLSFVYYGFAPYSNSQGEKLES